MFDFINFISPSYLISPFFSLYLLFCFLLLKTEYTGENYPAASSKTEAFPFLEQLGKGRYAKCNTF